MVVHGVNELGSRSSESIIMFSRELDGAKANSKVITYAYELYGDKHNVL